MSNIMQELNPKQLLTRNITNIIMEFEKATGVEVLTMKIKRADTTTIGSTSRQQSIPYEIDFNLQ